MNPEALDNQIALKQAQLGAAQQTLQYQTERDTFGGEMKQMFTEWIARATDVRQAMSALFEQTLGTVNNAILQTMTDKYHRGDWKAAGKSIATNVAGAGLSFAEGSIGKAFGFGGKMGTRDNPMWTRDAGTAVGAAGGSILKSVVDTTLTAGSSGNAIAKAFGLAASIPFLAAGGSLPAGMPAIVGERGPELFIPSGSGRVVPNDQLRAGGTQHVWNIDARGSSNPGAVRLAVQRGIMEAAPRIAAGSIAAAQDLASRKPTMSR
jgi:phage-related minor tail protein